jgi:hypothetical protein
LLQKMLSLTWDFPQILNRAGLTLALLSVPIMSVSGDGK